MATPRVSSKRLWIAVIALVLVVIVAVAAYSMIPKAPEKRGGTLVISLGTDIPIFDPQKSTGMQNLGIIRLVSETLTDMDPKTGEVKPNLAESWESSPELRQHGRFI